MSAPEICPRCQAHFEAREALVWGGVPLLFGVITAPGVSTKVQCPGCNYRFSATKIRFFGFLSANGLRWALMLAFFAGILFFVLASLL